MAKAVTRKVSNRSIDQPCLEQNAFDDGWDALSAAMGDFCDSVLQRKNRSINRDMNHMEYLTHYHKIVYVMCTGAIHNQHRIVYEQLEKWLKDNLHTKVTVQLQMLKTDPKVLSAVSKVYADYKEVRKWAIVVFSYIDDQYTKKHNIDSVDKLMLKAFHEAVYTEAPLQLRGLILEHVHRYRNQEDVSLEVLGNVIKFITEVGGSVAATPEDALKPPYIDDIEKPILDATRDYYRSKAQIEFLKRGGHYIKWAENRLQLEDSLS